MSSQPPVGWIFEMEKGMAKGDGVVQGTSGDGLIDNHYVDADGNMINHGDHIVKGSWTNDDTVIAGEGNDRVHGGSGDDTLYGDAGKDTLTCDPGHNLLDGGAGDDTFMGGAGQDNIDYTQRP